MKRIEITSPQIRGKAYLGIRDIVGWWSSQKSYDPRYKITEARLEDTVYFIIKTSGVPNDTKIGLQLYDLEELFFLDYLYPDKYKFNGKEETINTYINNNYAIIELQLPMTWTKDIKDDQGKVELYWKIKCNNISKISIPKYKTDYLSVRYSDKNIYIKPSPINKDFPEFYDSDGSLLVVAMASEVVCDEVNFLENINNDDEGSYVGLSDISEVLDDKILQPVINKKLPLLSTKDHK